jgi:hypothetical protein
MLNTSFKSTPNTSPTPLVYFMSTMSREQTKTNDPKTTKKKTKEECKLKGRAKPSPKEKVLN